MSEKLDAGSKFPSVDLHMLDGSTVTLPDRLATEYTVVLFYRGHW